jgi:hypothetical protein
MKRLAALVLIASLAAAACGGKSNAADPGTADLKPATEGVPGVVEVPVSGRNHVNGHVDYPTSPPAGGNHNPVWQNCGFYTVSLTNEYAVHSLEHGAVWITYTQSVAQSVKDTLAAKAKTSPYLLVSLYPDNPTPIVVTAWARQLRLEAYDDALVNQFISVYAQKGPTTPEVGATCRGGIGVPPDRPLST